MDETILRFISTHFTEPLTREFTRAFRAALYWEVDDLWTNYHNLLSKESDITPEDMMDGFTEETFSLFERIWGTNIVLNESATLEDHNNICDAIMTIGLLSPVGYSDITKILASDMDDHERFSHLIASVSTMDEHHLMTILDNVEGFIFDNLKELCDSTTHYEDRRFDGVTKIIENFKSFIAIHGDNNIGSRLVKANVTVGLPLEKYGLYFQDHLDTSSMDNLALDVLSLIYISEGGLSDTLGVYRSNSGLISQDIAIVSTVEGKMMNLIGYHQEAVKDASYKPVTPRNLNE